MDELQFGAFTLSVIIAVVLGVCYKLVGDKHLTDRMKVLIAMGVGVGLGVVSVPYAGLEWTVVNIVNNVLSGFMSAAAASGLYTWTHKSK